MSWGGEQRLQQTEGRERVGKGNHAYVLQCACVGEGHGNRERKCKVTVDRKMCLSRRCKHLQVLKYCDAKRK